MEKGGAKRKREGFRRKRGRRLGWKRVEIKCLASVNGGLIT